MEINENRNFGDGHKDHEIIRDLAAESALRQGTIVADEEPLTIDASAEPMEVVHGFDMEHSYSVPGSETLGLPPITTADVEPVATLRVPIAEQVESANTVSAEDRALAEVLAKPEISGVVKTRTDALQQVDVLADLAGISIEDARASITRLDFLFLKEEPTASELAAAKEKKIGTATSFVQQNSGLFRSAEDKGRNVRWVAAKFGLDERELRIIIDKEQGGKNTQ